LILKFFQLADMLLSKTIPEVNRKGQGCTLKPKAKVLMAAPPKKKVKTHSVEVEEIEDEDSTQNLHNWNASVLSVTGDVSLKKKVSVTMLPALHYSKHHQGIKTIVCVKYLQTFSLSTNNNVCQHCSHEN
jgi:hypothetical protein